MLARLLLGAFLTLGVMMFSISLYAGRLDGSVPGEAEIAFKGLLRLGALGLSLPVLWLLGLPLAEAIAATRRWLSTETLLLIGALSAWAASIWNVLDDSGEIWFETVCAILVLVHLGRWLDVRSRERVRNALTQAAHESLPRVTRLARQTHTGAHTGQGPGRKHAALEEVPVDQVQVGDRIRARPGEVLAFDGIVRSGRSFVETAHLTGEEEPRSIQTGDQVLAGTRVVDGSLEIEVSATRGDRLRDAIERSLQRALAVRPRQVQVADRFAALLFPAVVLLAAYGAWLARDQGAGGALQRSLTVVLIACPCALGIATPLAYWVALTRAWRRGIAVRSGVELERLARARRIFLDKTGTLTTSGFELVSVTPHGQTSAEDIVERAAALEAGSEHPVGRALRNASDSTLTAWTLADFRRLPGVGVDGRLNGRPHRLERAEDATGEATVVRLFEGAQALGDIALQASVLPEAAHVVRELAARGLEPTVLTGDGAGPARRIARELDVAVESCLLPHDKIARIEQAGRGAIFVGDGLNDAGALAAADVGIAVRGASPTSVESAGVVLMGDDLNAIPWLLDLARRAVTTARANLAWASLYNALGLYLALRGSLTPLLAAVAMVGSSALVIIHSLRIAPGDKGAVLEPQPTASADATAASAALQGGELSGVPT